MSTAQRVVGGLLLLIFIAAVPARYALATGRGLNVDDAVVKQAANQVASSDDALWHEPEFGYAC